MLGLCRRAGRPAPQVNVTIEGYLVDFVWREARLVVETDGWRAHGKRSSFERDRRRDADLLTAGWRVLRFTHVQLEQEPARVAATLARALGG
jgi:very-short-patch-repair endonuclease